MAASLSCIVLNIGPWGLVWYTSGRLKVFRHALNNEILWKQLYDAEEGVYLWN